MKTIYKGTNFNFSITIKVNDLPVNITSDTVKAILSVDYKSDPLISVNGDTATYGSTGKAIFEFDKTATDLPPGLYLLQAFWTNAPSKEYLVLDELVEVKNTVKRV